MNKPTTLLFSLCWAVVALATLAAAPAFADGHDDIEQDVTRFFERYLDVYNQRFGRPERSARFREALAELVHMPVMQSPPVGAPRVPDTMESFTRGFESFVTQLEGKGVTRLTWRQTQFQVLSANKVLANNVGIGLTADGEVAYETVSLYLLYRTDAGWKIALFSPYDPDRRIDLVQPRG